MFRIAGSTITTSTMTGVSTTLSSLVEEEGAATTESGAGWVTDRLQTTDRSALEMTRDQLASETEAASSRRVVGSS